MWLDKRFRKYVNINVEHNIKFFLWTKTKTQIDIEFTVNEHVFFK
jgi:hypothetical protein